MSWNITEKSTTGEVQYTLATHSDITATTSASLNVIGYSKGTVSFANTGSMTATLSGSLDGSNFFTLDSEVKPISPSELSWSIPIKQVRIECSANSMTNITLVMES